MSTRLPQAARQRSSAAQRSVDVSRLLPEATFWKSGTHAHKALGPGGHGAEVEVAGMRPWRQGGLIHAQDNGRTPGPTSGKAVSVPATGPAPHPLQEPAREAATAPPPGWPGVLPKEPRTPVPTTPSPPSRGLLWHALHPVFVACQCETVPCPSPTQSSKAEDNVSKAGSLVECAWKCQPRHCRIVPLEETEVGSCLPVWGMGLGGWGSATVSPRPRPWLLR